MRVVATFLLLFTLALAVFLYLRPRAASVKPSRVHHEEKAQAPEPPAAPKTNLATEPQDGFYIGKGDQRVFVRYGASDPLLQSFIQSVMDDSSDPKAQGRQIYLKLCGICHQPDGEGKDGLAPPLVGSEWALTPDGGRAARIVLNGLMGPIQVRGKLWNLAMPPWRDNLNDDQVALVLTYVRSQLGSNHAGAVAPEFVATARKEAHASPLTADELLRITGK